MIELKRMNAQSLHSQQLSIHSLEWFYVLVQQCGMETIRSHYYFSSHPAFYIAEDSAVTTFE